MSKPTGVVLVLDNSFNVIGEYRGVIDMKEADGLIVLETESCSVFLPKTFILELYKETN